MCLCFIILKLNAALFSCLLSSLFPTSLVLQSLVPSLYSLPGFQSLDDSSIILSIFSLQYFVWFRLLILFYALFIFIYNSTCFSFINYFCFMSLDNDNNFIYLFFFFYFFFFFFFFVHCCCIVNQNWNSKWHILYENSVNFTWK